MRPRNIRLTNADGVRVANQFAYWWQRTATQKDVSGLLYMAVEKARREDEAENSEAP